MLIIAISAQRRLTRLLEAIYHRLCQSKDKDDVLKNLLRIGAIRQRGTESKTLICSLLLLSFIFANAGCKRVRKQIAQTPLTSSVGNVYVSGLPNSRDNSQDTLTFENDEDRVPDVTCIVRVRATGQSGTAVETSEKVELRMYPNSSTEISLGREGAHVQILRIEKLSCSYGSISR